MSAHWPTYEEWLGSLGASDQQRARALTERFRQLGAKDPESWARSEISENIPQLARFMVLNTIKKEALDYWQRSGTLTGVAKYDRDFEQLLKRLRQAGLQEPEIAYLAQKIAALTAWHVVHVLDEGEDIEAEGKQPGWVLMEIGSDGEPTGRTIGGLHESADQFDPTRNEP